MLTKYFTYKSFFRALCCKCEFLTFFEKFHMQFSKMDILKCPFLKIRDKLLQKKMTA